MVDRLSTQRWMVSGKYHFNALDEQSEQGLFDLLSNLASEQDATVRREGDTMIVEVRSVV